MAESETLETQLKTLQSLLQPNEILTPDSPGYISHSQTWASQKQLSPRLVVRPTSVETLSKVITYLYTTPLDFAIYGHGFGSTSAKDVLVNTSAFNDFHFDRHSETVTIGAGQTWVDVYRKMEEHAPGYGSMILSKPCHVVVRSNITSRRRTNPIRRRSRNNRHGRDLVAIERSRMYL
jgi:cysteine desulfurase